MNTILACFNSCCDQPQQAGKQKRAHRQSKAGQIGIITLLIMAVILTIAISLSQRTTTEQQIATTQDEAVRTFNAAESGVEQALSKIESEGITLNDRVVDNFTDDTNTTSQYSIDPNSVFEMYVEENSTVEIPLADSNGDVTIQWWYEQSTVCANDQPAAILVSIYNSNNNQARHLGFDKCATNRDNNFDEGISNGNDGYSYSYEVAVDADDTIVRVRPLYNSTRVRISSDAIDKAQFTVNARAQTEQRTVAKAINVKRSRLGAPGFMDFTLVSGNNISH